MQKTQNLSKRNNILPITLGLIAFVMLSQTPAFGETISVNVNGNTYDVNYSVEGMTVSSVDVDTDFVSLIFTVDISSSNGVLEITFDRSFFDSQYQGIDDNFIVLADGIEPAFSEIETTTSSRTLQIQLPSGTEEVEIIGSAFGSPIPEEPTPEPTPEETPQPTPEPEKEIPASFVDPAQDPKFYVKRYITEPSYKAWFEENYPAYTFHEALDITKPVYDKLVAEVTAEQTPETPKPQDTKTPETPKPTQCGPGTILKEGQCVLDERCGPGTILKDGQCVAEKPKSEPISMKGLGKELGYGIIAAFIITGAIIIILALMSKASKQRN